MSAALARRTARACRHGAFATLDAADGAPEASLVAVAWRPDATPLLLLSDLARHTRNATADSRVALLLGPAPSPAGAIGAADAIGPAGPAGADPLTRPRVGLKGRLAPSADPDDRRRFLALHPEAAEYAAFADFRLHALAPLQAHLVAGFGRIETMDGDAWRLDAALHRSLVDGEAAIVAHMNDDHADAVALYAERLLGAPGGAWRLAGIDPEGIDLARGDLWRRLDFDAPVASPGEARQTLVALVRRAREIAANAPCQTGGADAHSAP